MENSKKNTSTEKIVTLCVALIVLGLLIFFLGDVFFPFIKLELARDFEGAKSLLLSKGLIGYITVSVIEALQMVVVFIPAEFIQLSSGMAYPWWMAIILCDIGVALGASIIYFLVNVFKFKGDIFSKRKRIEEYENRSKAKSTMIFMYLLFIMPIIPFGAICYYGSGKKLPYLKYIFTCVTGVIPSIFTSIVMGTAIKEFIANALPIWALILIIVLAAAILFSLILIVLKKHFFKNEDGEPNPWPISLIEKALIKLTSLKVKYKIINGDKVKNLSGPFIYLAEHHSWLDAMAVFNIDPQKNVVAVINEFYFRLPVIGKILRKAGHIGKKMFTPDVLCVKGILRTLKKGYPVMIFPEARLSTDGGPSYIDDKIAVLCKKTQVPVVLVEIRNNYFLSPKWRKGTYKGICEVEVKRILRPDEIESAEIPDLISTIRNNLSYNEFSAAQIQRFKSKNKAEGLHNILYLCPHCKSLYSNISYKNTLKCTKCGKIYNINDDYTFDGGDIPNIFEYYAEIKRIEKENLNNIYLDIAVDVEIYTDKVKKVRREKGVFHIDKSKVSFMSEISDLFFEYKVDVLEGIAYSVNKEFEMYYMNELYYFYPTEEKRAICTRVALLFELLKGEQNENR